MPPTAVGAVEIEVRAAAAPRVAGVAAVAGVARAVVAMDAGVDTERRPVDMTRKRKAEARASAFDFICFTTVVLFTEAGVQPSSSR